VLQAIAIHSSFDNMSAGNKQGEKEMEYLWLAVMFLVLASVKQ
jgi:hypothetical protein